jgi:hypothetical protein
MQLWEKPGSGLISSVGVHRIEHLVTLPSANQCVTNNIKQTQLVNDVQGYSNAFQRNRNFIFILPQHPGFNAN